MKKLKKIGLIILTFVALALAVLWGAMDAERGSRWARQVIRDRFPDISQISPAELDAKLRAAGPQMPLLLDARSAEEYAMSHIQGARHMDEKNATKEELGRLEPTRPVIVYCSAGYRSCLLARKLKAQGFQEVQNLEGGIFAWANDGRTVYRGTEAELKVHPYHALFARLLKPEHRP